MALAGGTLIGLSASLLLIVHGRIAGISGIVGDCLERGGLKGGGAFRGAFLLGLLAAGLGLRLVAPSAFSPSGSSAVALPFVIMAGLLVGYGTKLGGGCTSGHGVCGISRLSTRSIVATLTFMATGAATLYVVRHVLGAGR